MRSEIYFMFGAAAAAAFLLAALRSVSLRRYGSLFDPAGPLERRGGDVHGIYSGRPADIGFVASVQRTHRPGKVQLSVACAAPIRIEAYRKSLAVSFRKAVGILGDRKTGVEDLDRRFAFQFDDRPKTKASLARIESQQSLQTLADLGGDFVLLTNGRLTVEIPMTFVVPPGKGRVGQALVAMHTLASSMESALSVEFQGSEPESESLWPASPTSGAAIAGPVRFATLFVAMILGFLIVGPFWDFNGRVPWQMRLATVNARLPTVALLAGVAAFLASFLIPRRPVFWSLQVTWPLVAHAVLVLALYLVLLGSGISEIRQAFSRELEFIPAGLTTAATAAAVGLGSGLLAAILGSRLSADSARPSGPRVSPP